MRDIKDIWKEAQTNFPNLTLKKEENNGVILYNGSTDLANFQGNVKYIEDQLKLFLMGMIIGKQIK